MKSSILFLVKAIVLLWIGFSSADNDYYWPSPNFISHFVVMDDQFGLKNIVIDEDPNISLYANLKTTLNGPFGEANSSWGVSQNGAWMAYYDYVYTSESFTLSVYFYTPAAQNDGAIITDFASLIDFNIGYNGRTLQIRSTEETSESPTKSLAEVENFFTPNQWQFIAVTHEKDQKQLKLYNEEGQVTNSWDNFIIGERIATNLNIGVNWYDGRYDYMHASDAMACVFAYTIALSPSEIKELPEVCQRKGQPPSLTTTTTTTKIPTPPPISTQPWPADESLVAFWALSNALKTADIGPNNFQSEIHYDQLSMVTGPFGNKNTAFSGTNEQLEILNVKDNRLSTNGDSFTVSLYFRPTSQASGGIFEFVDLSGTNMAFQLRYLNLTVEATAGGETIGQYSMVQPQNTWTFVAFAFNNTTASLTVYSQFGVASPTTYQPFLEASNLANNNGVRLGHSTFWNQSLNVGDAVACFSIYSKALSWPEVKQLTEASRILNGEPLAGQPKLPMNPIPETTPFPTIPRYGQFPATASLRYSNQHICSASILSPFWLLTGAVCVQTPQDSSKYTVIVGEHDLEVDEKHQNLHHVSMIVTSGDSDRDIALVQLSTPIDFTNDYVSDSFVYTGIESSSQTWKDEILYFVGWGLNGRHYLISQTLPRMFLGNFLSDEKCSKAWPGEYETGADLCFQPFSPEKNLPCTGDEGGPVYIRVSANSESGAGDRLLMVGIYYGRDKACSTNKPGLFVNIGNYATWISEQTACAIPNVSNPSNCPQ